MATMKQNHSKQKITEHFSPKLHQGVGEGANKELFAFLIGTNSGQLDTGYKFFGNLSPS